MSERMTYGAHLRAVLALGLPLIGSNLAQMALHVTDTVMVGWYGVVELAAVVLGGAHFFLLFILGAGFAQAVMPMVAASLGRGDETQVRRDTRMGIWLSLAYGVLIYPAMYWARPILLALGQDEAVAGLAQDYLRVAGLGMVPALMVMAMKGFLSALNRAGIVLWATLIAVLANIALNWALIFGNWGAPELGVRGAALASVATQVLTVAIMVVYAIYHPSSRRFHLFQRFWRPDWPALRQVYRLGWPIGLTGLFESGLFEAAAIMMGWIGTMELAAHGIALQIAAVTFMAHLGVSMAATVRTGNAVGARDAPAVRDGAVVSIALSLAVAAVVTVCFLVFPGPLIRLFLDSGNPEVGAIVAYGTALLAMAALFQLADATQVMALGLLRGLHDTRGPMIIASVSYWMIGIPASYLLAFKLDMGGVGLWLGLVIGLAVAAILLMWRFWTTWHLAVRA